MIAEAPTTTPAQAPAMVRRRVWSSPSLASHALAVLTPLRLYLTPRGGGGNAELVHAIQSGGDLEELVGPFATIVDLGSVIRVELDLLTNALSIEYRPQPRTTARVRVECQDHETADEIYTKIWRRLGRRFVVFGDRPPWTELARVPLVIMAGVFLATVFLALLANWAADSASSWSGWKPFAAVDWKVIGGIGGAVLAVLQVVLYRRLTVPPTRLELRESSAIS